MEHIDPAMAARVWQRVQNTSAPCVEKPGCPLEGIPVVPAIRKEQTEKSSCKKVCGCRQNGDPGWILCVLVWVLIMQIA